MSIKRKQKRIKTLAVIMASLLSVNSSEIAVLAASGEYELAAPNYVSEETDENLEGVDEKTPEEITEEADAEEESTEESADEVSETEERAEESTEESVDERAEESTEESVDERAEESTEESVDESAEESTDEVSETEERAEESTEESKMEECTEEISMEASEEDSIFRESETEENFEDLIEEVDVDILDALDGKYFTYTLDEENNATITGYTGNVAELILPDSLDGHPVTMIGESVFSENTTLTKVVIPDTVVRIGEKAFEGCTNITDLTLSHNLVTLDQYAFGKCTGIQSICIPKSLKKVNGYAPFRGCSSLNDIRFEEGVTLIPNELFASCSGLEEIVIPDSVTTIGDSAFWYCGKLKKITLSKNLTEIGTSAFHSTGFTSIEFPESLSDLGQYSFAYCYSLEKVVLPQGMKNVRNGAFNNCKQLSEVILPDTIEVIQSNSFTNTAITSIVLPDSVKTIGYGAFSECSKLKTVVLGKETTSLEEKAFYSCIALESVTLNDKLQTIKESVFEKCTSLKTITLPDSVSSLDINIFSGDTALETVQVGNGITLIPANMFDGCKKLDNVVIPYSVTSIEAGAFSGCESLKNVTIAQATVDIDDEAFEFAKQLTIYGVKGSYAQTYAGKIGASFSAISIPATAVQLDYTKLKMLTGEKLRLNLTVTPENFTDTVTWKSDNEDVVKVDSLGNLTPVDTGTTKVWAIVGKKKVYCTVSVEVPVSSIYFGYYNDNYIDAGSPLQLYPTIRPENATNQGITWTTSDKTIATVDQNGVVIGKKKGDVVITATAKDGYGGKGTKKVHVLNTLYQCSKVSQLQSPHKYENDSSNIWRYTLEGAEAILVTFDSRTKLSDNDYIELSGADRSNWYQYKETSLASKTVRIAGDTVNIQLVSFESESDKDWGFAVTDVRKEIKATSIELTQTNLTLGPGKSETLKAIVTPSNSTDEVEWYTNSDLVTVDQNGKVTGKKRGTTWVYAKVNGMTASCEVKVIQLAKSITLNHTELNLKTGNWAELRAELLPSNVTDRRIVWKSSDTSVATVNEEGNVTATGPGSAIITATTRDGSKLEATCTVNVTQPVTGITLNKNTLKVALGKSATLKATIAPDNASNKAVKWSSSNKNVAMVDSKGVVKAVGVGKAVITVEAKDGSGQKATCTVTVVKLVETVTLNKASLNLKTGKTYKLVALIEPADATDTSVTWSSGDKKIATVDSAGVVTAKGPGTTTITAVAKDGSGKKAECTVKVTQPVTGITLDQTELTVKIQGTATLKATVAPENASNKALKWTSTNEKVATVSTKGVVTTVGLGTTTITATAADGSGVKAECKITVVQPVTGIKLNVSDKIIHVNDTLALKATVSPKNAYDKTVKWSTSDKSVATVDANGKVKAIAPGTVTITAKAADGSGVKKTCKVKVTQLVTVAFDDISDNDWWVDAVQYVYDNDIMAGDGKSFLPTKALTREQFVQVLYNNSGKPDVTGLKCNFKDVRNEWYKDAVVWANKEDITSGYENGNFGVGDMITREQLTVMLYKYAKLKGYDLTTTNGLIDQFSDGKKVDSWARESLNWAVSQGIMSGKGTGTDRSKLQLDPLGSATRAECATMMMKLLVKNGATK